MRTIVFTIAAIAATALGATAGRTVTYARSNQAVVLDLQWGAINYGTIQWQRSTDGGATWTDVKGATSATYTFKMTGNVLYRAHIEGDRACPAIDEEREIRLVKFTPAVMEVGAHSVTMKISGVDFAGAEIVEYGWCASYASLKRDYTMMPRTKVGNVPPAAGEWAMVCDGLMPWSTYSVRAYFELADGTVMWGPAQTVKTLAGPAWCSENWEIGKTSISPRFEIAGDNTTRVEHVRCYIGRSVATLAECSVTVLGDRQYSAEAAGLEPHTDYVARVTAVVDGKEIAMEKTVRTWSDYSTACVDATVKPVAHTIEWAGGESLVRLSPEGQQVEYPRMCRIDESTIVLTYHGGNPSNWGKIYMRKSRDNGDTWSEPVAIFDKEASEFGNNYLRFQNPELILQKNGWLLLTFVGRGSPETNDNCHVIACISRDGGDTWDDPIIVGRGRSWEPQVVELPGGELELLVSSEAAWWQKQSTLYQEIVCARSTDGGLTWTRLTRASYNPGKRDGMPVTIVQQGNKGLLTIIECIWGSPSPVLLHRDLDAEWDQSDWDGVQDSERWAAGMNGGGAPYIIQLPTGETLITAYYSPTGEVWRTARPRVYIGDNTGHNFKMLRNPLEDSSTLPFGTGAVCCSFFMKDDTTVWLLISKAKYTGSNRDASSIELLEGKIVAY
ncbi:MAG: sialidase family protein [Bacteroidales bacterium]|nr:sialidase family protein [Bacteroidales bacterium]